MQNMLGLFLLAGTDQENRQENRGRSKAMSELVLLILIL
jgi:hypothetical protein